MLLVIRDPWQLVHGLESQVTKSVGTVGAVFFGMIVQNIGHSLIKSGLDHFRPNYEAIFTNKP